MIAMIRIWLWGAVTAYALALLGHAWIGTEPQHLVSRRAFDIVAALPWGVLLLGAIARWQPGWPAPYWRLLLLGFGFVLAALGAWLIDRRIVVDELAAALLGLAIAAILSRVLPGAIVRRWLGQDPRC